MPSLVIRVTRGSVIYAADKLKSVISVYCPIETQTRIHRNDPNKNRRRIEKPLFPGYAFVEDTPEARKVDLKFTLGDTADAHYMHWNDKYLLISDREIDRVKAIERSIADLAAISPIGRIWKPGDSVTILRGVLAGAMGTVVNLRKRTALVAMKGRSPIFMDVAILG
jgi:transcription antitermination factor NusG